MDYNDTQLLKRYILRGQESLTKSQAQQAIELITTHLVESLLIYEAATGDRPWRNSYLVRLSARLSNIRNDKCWLNCAEKW